MVAKENDDVGNLLLFVFVFLNEDEKNTFLEEEEEEEKVLVLLFIVVVAIRPRSAGLIINKKKSLKNNVFRYIMEKRAIF